MNWNMILAVGAGGALGAIGRYIVAGKVARLIGGSLPLGTLAVNVIGSLCMGLLIELVALRLNLSMQMQAFLAVGLLGGFTTFSSFSMEVVLLMERNNYSAAFSYALGSVVLSVVGLFAGMYFVRAVSS
ncbi:MAG: fluoride efflux transporter CrcB [Sphingomonadales bacterium]